MGTDGISISIHWQNMNRSVSSALLSLFRMSSCSLRLQGPHSHDAVPHDGRVDRACSTIIKLSRAYKGVLIPNQPSKSLRLEVSASFRPLISVRSDSNAGSVNGSNIDWTLLNHSPVNALKTYHPAIHPDFPRKASRTSR